MPDQKRKPRPSQRAVAPAATVVSEIQRCRTGAGPAIQSDRLAREEPLEIRVRGKSVAVTMRTPGHDDELAAGFLLTEGLIHRPTDVTLIAPCLSAPEPGNVLNVFLATSVAVDLHSLTRHVFASSSCGVCGKASIEAVRQHFAPVTSRLRVGARLLSGLPARMRQAQAAFAQTGGLHAAAIFDAQGKLIVLREDIGRHNAVDKVLGYAFLRRRLPLADHILLVSGRASFEIVQKALAARLPVVCAVSAPSSLAVDFARESGQTLVGFLRDNAMNIYSHPDRIRFSQDQVGA
jgi:FdhD protein